MAVERNAVREGTRWWFDGEEVLVQEVTPKSIVFFGDDCGLGLIAIGDFLVRAEDPAISRHERMMKRFSRLIGRDPSDEIGGAILYLLERIGAPVPGPVPAWAGPVPHQVLAVAEPLPAEPDTSPADYCAVTLPHCEPLIEHGTIEEYDRVKRDFVASDDEPPSMKKRRGSGWAA